MSCDGTLKVEDTPQRLYKAVRSYRSPFFCQSSQEASMSPMLHHPPTLFARFFVMSHTTETVLRPINISVFLRAETINAFCVSNY